MSPSVGPAVGPTMRGRRDALDAVARAVAHADERRLGDDLGPIDAWRVRRAAKWAEVRVPQPGTDPVGDKIHRLRVTWLRIAGAVADGAHEVRDAGLAESRYHALLDTLGPRPEPRSLSKKTRLIVLACLAVAALTTVAIVVVASAPAPPVGDGEMLPPEQEEALAAAITQWVIGLDRLTRMHHDGALDRVVQEARDTLNARRLRILTPEIRAFLGERATEAFIDVLDHAERTSLGTRWEEDAEALAEAVRVFNRALADARRAYFIDSYAARYRDGRPETALFFFRVAARQSWQVADDPGADPIAALHLRRLDKLNIVQLLLGYTSERMDVAALLLDRIEKEVVTRVGPSLQPDRPMPLELDEDDDDGWVDEVRRVAGERIREAFAAELPDDHEGLQAFGALLGQRQELVADWNRELVMRGVSFSIDSFVVPDGMAEEIERYLGRNARRQLDAIQDALESHAERFARVLARHARPVEQHEVQHRLDYAVGEAFRAPQALLDLFGVEATSELARHDDIMRTAHELSAYTAEIARDPRWAAINLTLLTEHLLEGGGGAEEHAAILVLDGLADELGLPGPRLAESRPVTPIKAAPAYLALMRVPGDNLARAAGALWTRWYERALPTLHPVQPEVASP